MPASRRRRPILTGDQMDQRLFRLDYRGPPRGHVGLLDHRQQRSLMPTPRLQQAREVGALAELGDLEVGGADPGVPFPLLVAVAVGKPPPAVSS
jgi:hypothetical protein